MVALGYSSNQARPSRAAAIFFLISVPLLFIVLAIWPLASANGLPAFQQDWQWPVHPAQCAPYTYLGVQPWNSAGIGSAQSYPAPWLPYILSGSLCSLAGPHAGLVIYLIALLALSALGIAWLARMCKLGGIATGCAIACYLGNPVLLDKLHAGHLHFLFSYATLPWFLAAILDERTLRRPLLLGALLGVASAQQQFFVFGIGLGFLLGLRHGAGWFVRTGLPAVAVALLFTMPQWILAAHTASAANFNAYRPIVHWEESQSVPFPQAIRFLGYIGGYDRALPDWLRAMLWSFPLIALAGAVTTIVRRNERMWILGGFTALLLVVGFYGPLAPLLSFLVERSAAFAAMRELYTFEAVVVLCYAMLIGLGIRGLSSNRRFKFSALPLGVVLIATALCVAAYETRNIPSYLLSHEGAALVTRIASARGLTRYLPVPSGLPQSVRGNSASGLSPFTLPIGAHASALDTLYETPYASIVAAQDASGQTPAPLLRALGISHVLAIAGVEQSTAYEPQLRSVFPPPATGAQTTWHLTELPAARITFLSIGSPQTVERMDTGTPIDLNGESRDVNPKRGWARTALWNNLPGWMYDHPSGIFTTLPLATVGLPAHSSVLAGSADGKLAAAGCRRGQPVDMHFAVYNCDGAATFRGMAPIAVSEAISSGRIAFFRTSARGAHKLGIVEDRRWRATLTIAAPPGSVLVLRERYDPGWKCASCDAIHARADGFANAWIFPNGAHGRITLLFEPARTYFAALALSMAALLAAIIQSFLLYVRRRAAYRRYAGPAEVRPHASL